MTASGSPVVLADGLTLAVIERGDRTGPALVLLPGPTDSATSYLPVIDRLPGSMRVVAVSQRGHGDSDKPATGYGIEDFASDVIPLLDALEIERAVVAGHSGSCLTARRVALDHPERVAGLVLEASPITMRGDARLEAFVDSVVAELRDPIDEDFARSFVVDTSSGGVDPVVLDALVRDLLTVPAHVWQQAFAGVLHYDDTAELDRIAVPTLLIWGDADGLIPRAAQDELVRRLRHSELVVYPGVEHTPRWEQPGRFAADVAAFVDRIT